MEIIFAALALFVIMKGGSKLEVAGAGGEKHGDEAVPGPAASAASAVMPASAAK